MHLRLTEMQGACAEAHGEWMNGRMGVEHIGNLHNPHPTSHMRPSLPFNLLRTKVQSTGYTACKKFQVVFR